MLLVKISGVVEVVARYGLGGLLPPKTTKGLKLKVLKMQFLIKNVVF